MSDPTPATLTIDLSAIQHNYRALCKTAATGQQVIGVIKSNAYGHGLVEIAKALLDAGAPGFAVRDLSEAIRLREAGIKTPILILLGIRRDEIELLQRYQLTPVVYDLATAEQMNDWLALRNSEQSIHIKIDTGMTRVGVLPEAISDFFDAFKKLSHLKIEGVMSHLAQAINPEPTSQQEDIFKKARSELTRAGWDIPIWHLGNSIAAINGLFPDCQWVRAGIALYGAYPDPSLENKIDLRPALSWTSRLLTVKSVPKGRSVSYDLTYQTTRDTKVGLVPVGYADGYPRLLSNRGSMIVCGQRAPILGRVCMDLTMIDLTDIPAATAGTEVTLLGTNDHEQIRAEEIAGWADTISYEVFTGLSLRMKRDYQGNQ